jgi:hypothetical protein
MPSSVCHRLFVEFSYQVMAPGAEPDEDELISTFPDDARLACTTSDAAVAVIAPGTGWGEIEVTVTVSETELALDKSRWEEVEEVSLLVRPPADGEASTLHRCRPRPGGTCAPVTVTVSSVATETRVRKRPKRQ